MSTSSGVAGDIRPGAPALSASPGKWMALASSGLAWMFDAMDFQLFTLLLYPSVSDLIGSTDTARVAATGGIIVSSKLLAWGIGGIVFGVLADRMGRARTMLVTVLIYATFTGLSGLARTWWQLAALQALAGLGLGGEWAAGVALVAETWPERTRARASQVMQMCFGVGGLAAALLNLMVGPYGWRLVFIAGVIPAPVIIVLRLFVREPERWRAARGEWMADPLRARLTGTLRAIFAPGMRRRTIVGVLAVVSILMAANSLTPLSAAWVRVLLPHDQQAAAGRFASEFFTFVSLGGLAGYTALIWLNEKLPRRWAYTVVLVGCSVVVLMEFTTVTTVGGLLAFAPLYGFFVVGGIGFFAVYLPELFPTAIRATGQGFCWNMGRTLAALGPIGFGALVGVLGSIPAAARLGPVVFIIGMIAIWFGPETKGQPLRD